MHKISNPKEDFRVFLFFVWKHLNLPPPTRSQYILAEWLANGSNRLVIQAFRGVGKSFVAAAYVCWRLLNDPQIKIMVVSASKSRSDDFSSFVLKLINQMPLLRHLRPRDGQRSSKISFDVAPATADQSSSVKSVGMTGQLTGSRADLIIADDIEVTGNSATQMMRDKLKELVKEFAAVLKPLETSKIIYLGTPQTEQSIYNALPERGYEIRILPARYPTEKQQMRYGAKLAEHLVQDLVKNPKLVNQPVCKRFGSHILLEKEAEYGRAGFALQFMLDTSLADADKYPLKLRDLIVMDTDPKLAPVELAWGNDPSLCLSEVPTVGFDGDRLYRPFMVSKEHWQPYTGSIMAIDPSGRGEDETTYAIVSMLNGRLFLLDAGGDRLGYEEVVLERLAHKAKQYSVKEIIIEPNFGDGMFNKLLTPVMQRIYPCRIKDSVRSVGQKERRIVDTLEPVMNGHRLVVDRSLIERDFKSTQTYAIEQRNRYQLFYQMTRITRDRGSLMKDDRLDALAIAVHYWTDAMGRDTQKAAEQSRQKIIEEHIRKMRAFTPFGKTKRPTLVYDPLA
ncbi:phage terminase large subunit [Bartonella sp. DGB2]|uniref:phage terminase large subunit n=1 Tax=Bartonella sp. DGB2 TaxID=3388426 RepID=UPI00398FBB73